MEAKVTHARYGKRSSEALLSIFQNCIIERSMKNHSNATSTSARKRSFSPKNRKDHTLLSASCIPNSSTPTLTFFSFQSLKSTRYRARPIKTYRVVHAGANSQFGGLKNGFWRKAYQEETESKVKKEPTMPAAWHTIIERTIAAKSFSFTGKRRQEKLFRSPFAKTAQFSRPSSKPAICLKNQAGLFVFAGVFVLVNAIEARGLSKSYKELKAVDSIDLLVESGTIFGLLGPNGAGKTTLISVLVTMRKPSSGEAKVNGFDVESQPGEVRKSLGIVFQDPSLDDELTALENLEMHAALYSVPKNKRRKRIEEVISLVGLEKQKKRLVKEFSGGMKRRLEIARGLVHHPKVLFLDEPTIGLDPQTRAGIWKYIKALNKKEKVTIVLTTHYMDEADSVCNKIAIIDQGRVIALGSPAELKNSLGGDIVSIKCSKAKTCPEILSKLNWVKAVKVHDGFVDARVEKGEEKIPKILRVLEKKRIAIESVNLRKPSLDDVFIHYTGKTIREKEADPKAAMRMRRRAWGHRR